MNADRIKKAVLALLAVVALYIWWGNLKLLAPDGPAMEENPGSYQKPVKATGKLAYRAPQVNPFMTVNPSDLEPAVDVAPVRPASVGQRWGLVGLVKDKHSAAILKNSQNATVVIQPEDSVDGWAVAAVGQNFVTVKKDSWRDTLWLWQKTGQ